MKKCNYCQGLGEILGPSGGTSLEDLEYRSCSQCHGLGHLPVEELSPWEEEELQIRVATDKNIQRKRVQKSMDAAKRAFIDAYKKASTALEVEPK